jgi:hypothetical protein
MGRITKIENRNNILLASPDFLDYHRHINIAKTSDQTSSAANTSVGFIFFHVVVAEFVVIASVDPLLFLEPGIVSGSLFRKTGKQARIP